MSTPSDWFAPPSGPPSGTSSRPPSGTPGVPQGPSAPPPAPQGPSAPPPVGYPQQAYYAPGWSAPVPPVPPTRRRAGRRVALGVAAAVVLVAVVGGGIGVRAWLESRPLGAVAAAVTASPGRLTTGHCVADLPADGDVTRVTVVPCAAPHAAEVVATRSLPAGRWPGQAEVDATLARWCEMDSAERAAGFHAVVWAPSERGWARGDRTGLCLAALDAGTATGSFVAGDAVRVG